MVINRAFVRETVQTAGAVALVLVTIFVVVRFVTFLRDAAKGNLPIDEVLMLMWLKFLTNVDLLLSLTLYVAILMVIARWIRDNELTVIAAAGIGLRNFLRPLAVIAAVAAGVSALFALYISPLSERSFEAVSYTHLTLPTILRV